jgi:hypothetical protein
MGYPATPKLLSVFTIAHEEPFQLTTEELLTCLILVWTDRKVVRLVSSGRFDFKFAAP